MESTDKLLRKAELFFSSISIFVACGATVGAIAMSLLVFFFLNYPFTLTVNFFIAMFMFLTATLLKLFPFFILRFKFKRQKSFYRFKIFAIIWLIVYGSFLSYVFWLLAFTVFAFKIIILYTFSTYATAFIWFIQLKRSQYEEKSDV